MLAVVNCKAQARGNGSVHDVQEGGPSGASPCKSPFQLCGRVHTAILHALPPVTLKGLSRIATSCIVEPIR